MFHDRWVPGCGFLLALLAGWIAAAEPAPPRHRFLCADNATPCRLLYVDQITPERSWSQTMPGGIRDLQVLREGATPRILVSNNGGAAEYALATGLPSGWAVSRASGIQTAVRLPDGHTLLGGKSGTVTEVDADGKELRTIVPREKVDIRLLRPLPNGNLLLSCVDRTLREMAPDGSMVRSVPLQGKGFKAVQLANGNYLSSTGDLGQIQEVDATGRVVRFVGGKAEHPRLGIDFSSGWDVLANGNIVMCNWLGHGKHGKGVHLAEFTADNRVVWTWQDHEAARQITNALMLE